MPMSAAEGYDTGYSPFLNGKKDLVMERFPRHHPRSLGSDDFAREIVCL